LFRHFFEIEVSNVKDGIIKCRESVRGFDHEFGLVRLLELKEASLVSDTRSPSLSIIFLQGVEFHIAMNIALITFEGVGSLHFSNSCSTQCRSWSPFLQRKMLITIEKITQKTTIDSNQISSKNEFVLWDFFLPAVFLIEY
jgi:hypothetical protein